MSYADMITLLLAFFVVFVATSEPKKDSFVAATQGLRAQFGVINFETPYDGMYKNLVGVVASNKADRNVAVTKTAEGIEVELSSLQFFKSGTANVQEEELSVLQELAKTLKEGSLAQYAVIVESHTSDATKPAAEFASNWELSSARAALVVNMLATAGVDSKRMSARGLADTIPEVPNTDAQGRPIPENQARNERVVIRVEKP